MTGTAIKRDYHDQTPREDQAIKKIILVFVIGGIAGVIFSGAFASFVQYSNSPEFCISCHEMKSTVYEEYIKTSHYENTSGVRATCADCHAPHGSWIQTVIFKTYKTKELFYHFAGKLDTEEKFEAHRLEMAQRVWKLMEETDSRECRHCHARGAMLLDKQANRARVQHEDAEKEGKTCIDCHKGLAHKPVHKELEKEQEKTEEQSFTL